MSSSQTEPSTEVDWEEIRDATRVRHELSWFVVRVAPPFQWGCYVITCRRRTTGELLLETGRVELTTVTASPDLDRALHGGPGCLYFGPPLRLYPSTHSVEAA